MARIPDLPRVVSPDVNVLVVDVADGLEPISLALEREGFAVLVATTAAAALAQTHVWPPAVVIVAARLVDGSGLDVLVECKRRNPEVQVLVTGKGDDAEHANALVLGADDYVAKPYSPREVAARVVSMTRKRRSGATTLDLDELSIDRDARRVTIAGRTAKLTAREMDLLLHLASHPRQTFGRDQLVRDVWGDGAWVDTDTVVELMCGLRRAVESDPSQPRWLMTIPGVGYRFEPGFADRCTA